MITFYNKIANKVLSLPLPEVCENTSGKGSDNTVWLAYKTNIYSGFSLLLRYPYTISTKALNYPLLVWGFYEQAGKRTNSRLQRRFAFCFFVFMQPLPKGLRAPAAHG